MFQSNRSQTSIVNQLTLLIALFLCDFEYSQKQLKLKFFSKQCDDNQCTLLVENFCGFYFSHIHAEGFQHAHKSVSNLHAKDSARWLIVFKGALSGLRQFLATETPMKMMKNDFYFTSKALFVLKIFKFLS